MLQNARRSKKDDVADTFPIGSEPRQVRKVLWLKEIRLDHDYSCRSKITNCPCRSPSWCSIKRTMRSAESDQLSHKWSWREPICGQVSISRSSPFQLALQRMLLPLSMACFVLLVEHSNNIRCSLSSDRVTCISCRILSPSCAINASSAFGEAPAKCDRAKSAFHVPEKFGFMRLPKRTVQTRSLHSAHW